MSNKLRAPFENFRALSLLLAAALIATLSACNTFEGVGKDVEAGGQAIQEGSEDAEEAINN